jgi:hypothetical protein
VFIEIITMNALKRQIKYINIDIQHKILKILIIRFGLSFNFLKTLKDFLKNESFI